MNYYSCVTTPIGNITIASGGEALTGLWFDGQKYDRDGLDSNCMQGDLPIFEETKEWLSHYFSGQEPKKRPLLQLSGTPFQQLVAQIMSEIPYGQVVTYGEIATQVSKQLGREHMSAQAIGNAVGHNPISLLIPCHRVVGADGSLTGYAGGVWRKKYLLELEGIDLKGAGLYLPKKKNPQ